MSNFTEQMSIEYGVEIGKAFAELRKIFSDYLFIDPFEQIWTKGVVFKLVVKR